MKPFRGGRAISKTGLIQAVKSLGLVSCIPNTTATGIYGRFYCRIMRDDCPENGIMVMGKRD